MTWLVATIGRIIADFFAAMIGDKRANSDAKDLGAANAQIKTDQIIKDIADAQANNNAQFRDLDSVLDRLQRDTIAKSTNDNTNPKLKTDLPRTK